MTIKIIALAVTAAVAASSLLTTQVAAEEASKPEFYGMLYLSLDNLPGDQWRLKSNNSRVGVKQAIPLQNGLTAVWKVEVGVFIDEENNGDRFTHRDTYLGLKGAYGQIVGGRFDTPLRRSEGKVDAFNHLHGDISAVLGGQSRVSNQVEYSSPKFAHTQLIASFIPGEREDLDGDGTDDTDLANAYSIAAVYEHNNLYAALAADLNGEAKTTSDGLQRTDRIQLAAKYQLGQASIGGIIQHAKDSETSDLKENALILSTTYQLNEFLLKAQYGLNKGKDTNDELGLLALGVDYRLDPSSFVTLAYAERVDDEHLGAKEKEKVVTLGFNQRF